MTEISLSVVVVTRRCPPAISHLIELFDGRNGSGAAELIIVCDARAGGQHGGACGDSERVRLYSSGIRGRIGALRNIGISHARGGTILFLDDDCRLDVRGLLNALNYAGCGKIVRGLIDFSGDGLFAKIDAAMRTARYDRSKNIAYTPNLIVPRGTFDEYGLFDDRFYYGSDGEFSDRILNSGETVSIAEDVRVVHLCRSGFVGLIGKSFRYGVGRYLRRKVARERGYVVPVFPAEPNIGLSLFARLTVAATMVARAAGFATAPILYRK